MDTYIGDGNFNGLRPRKWGDLRDCVAEADQMASDFVAWLQNQDFYPETSIIILGDHLLPIDRLGSHKLPSRNQREPYNVFINADPQYGTGPIHRNFAAFDLAPTILEAIGARWEGGRLGLGVSLFRSGEKTLFEEDGPDFYEHEVRKKSAFYESLFRSEGRQP